MIVLAAGMTLFGLSDDTTACEIVPHDTPDGQVERAVAVVIIGRTIELTYQIGINPTTTKEQLVAWQVDGIQEAGDDDTELAQLFCDELKTRLANGLSITVDGNQLNALTSEVAPFAMHHKSAVVTIVTELPDSAEEMELVITDNNWPTLPGGARYAIKARKNALLTGSNASPIIIRSPRIELGELEHQKRAEACTLRATVRVLPASDD